MRSAPIQVSRLSMRFYSAFFCAVIAAGITGCGKLQDAYMVDSLATQPGYLPVDPHSKTSQQVVPPPFDLDTGTMPDGKGYFSVADFDSSAKIIPKSADDPETEPKDGAANEQGALPETRQNLSANAKKKKQKNGDDSGLPAAQQNSQQLETMSVPDIAAATLGEQEVLRNRLGYYLIYRSKLICEAHEASIMADSNALDFALSEMSTVLSGVGGLVTGANASRILSGAATLVDSTQGNFNTQFYQGKLSSAIVTAIDETRTKVLLDIQAGFAKKYADYDVDHMIADIVEYHQDCSFFKGIVALANAANRIPASSDELQGQLDRLVAAKKTIQSAETNPSNIELEEAPSAPIKTKKAAKAEKQAQNQLQNQTSGSIPVKPALETKEAAPPVNNIDEAISKVTQQMSSQILH